MNSEYKTCLKCKQNTLYLVDSFHFICEECDEDVDVEEFIEEEPELYDIDGDRIIY